MKPKHVVVLVDEAASPGASLSLLLAQRHGAEVMVESLPPGDRTVVVDEVLLFPKGAVLDVVDGMGERPSDIVRSTQRQPIRVRTPEEPPTLPDVDSPKYAGTRNAQKAMRQQKARELRRGRSGRS